MDIALKLKVCRCAGSLPNWAPASRPFAKPELEMEGFITQRPNAATYVTKLTIYVTKLTIQDAEKIFSVRRVLESYAVEQAAQLAGPEQIRRLEAGYLASTFGGSRHSISA